MNYLVNSKALVTAIRIADSNRGCAFNAYECIKTGRFDASIRIALEDESDAKKIINDAFELNTYYDGRMLMSISMPVISGKIYDNWSVVLGIESNSIIYV